MISVRNLTVEKGNRAGDKILDNISVDFNDGISMIIGPNGSGKTTLLKCILNIPKFEGKIVCNKGSTPCTFSTNLDIVYRLLNTDVKALSKMYFEMIGGDYSSFIEIISKFKLSKILDSKIYHLSTGELKLFGLSMAVALDSEYMLLDEPFENLDPSRKEMAIDLVIESGKNVLVTTHDLTLFDKIKTDSFYLMVSGQLYGRFETENFKKMYISKNKKRNTIGEIDHLGMLFYITLDEGDYPIYSYSNIEEILGGN